MKKKKYGIIQKDNGEIVKKVHGVSEKEEKDPNIKIVIVNPSSMTYQEFKDTILNIGRVKPSKSYEIKNKKENNSGKK